MKKKKLSKIISYIFSNKLRNDQSTEISKLMQPLEPRFMFDGAAVETVDIADGVSETEQSKILEALNSNDQADATNSLLELFDSNDPNLEKDYSVYKEVIIIDSRVKDIHTLIKNISRKASVEVVNRDESGISVIADMLSKYSNLDAVHIISHGRQGELYLGNNTLNSDNLPTYQNDLSRWGESISSNGDLLFYGCNVAEGDAGQAFIDILKGYIDKGIAASEDITGNKDLGGNWIFEYDYNVDYQSIFSKSMNYDHILTPSLLGEEVSLNVIFTTTGNTLYSSTFTVTAGAEVTNVSISDSFMSSGFPQNFSGNISVDVDDSDIFVRFNGTAQGSSLLFEFSSLVGESADRVTSATEVASSGVIGGVNSTYNPTISNNVVTTGFNFFGSQSGTNITQTTDLTLVVDPPQFITQSAANLVEDLVPGSGGSYPHNIISNGNMLYFTAIIDDINYYEVMYVYDTNNPSSGPQLLFDKLSSGLNIGFFDEVVLVDGVLYFNAYDENFQNSELYSFDVNNPSAGVQLVADINPGSSSGNPRELIAVGNTLYFRANDGINGYELFSFDTNNPGAGVQLVADINPGSSSSHPDWLIEVGNTLYFGAEDGINGYELFSFDTNNPGAGAQLVADINPGSSSSYLGELIAVGNTLYFGAEDDTNGYELFSFDTSNPGAGVQLVADINPGSEGSYPVNIISNGNMLYFTAYDINYYEVMYVYDTNNPSSGPQLLFDKLSSGLNIGFFDEVVLVNGVLYFNAYDENFQNSELYSFDVNNPSAGVQLVADINPGSSSSYPSSLIAVGETLYFGADDGTNGDELHSADLSFEPFETLDIALGSGKTQIFLNDIFSISANPSDFNSGELLLINTGNFEDDFTIKNIGSGFGEISVSGSVISYEGNQIGTIDAVDNGLNGNNLKIIFTSVNANEVSAEALIRAIEYENTTMGVPTASRTIQLTLDDGQVGVSDPISKTLNVIVTNNSPNITVESGDSASDTLTETNSGLTLTDTLTVTDLDLTDTVSVAVSSVVESGNTSGIANATLLAMMSVTSGDILDNTETVDTFTWSFDSGVEAFDYLAAGESLVLTYTLTVTDAPTGATDTQTVVITINGTNDAPVISIEAGDSAAESLTESNAGLTVSDTLTTTDLDLTDTVSVAVTSVVESGNTSGIANATLLGMMSATTGNFIDGAETQDTFSWSFDSGVEAFDYLAAGESLVLTYTLTVTDAPTGATDTQDVVITINGTNDVPVISIEAGDSAAESLTESNAGLTVSDTLTTTDLDLTDTVSVAVTSVVESGNTSGIANATLLGMMSATTGNFIDGTETVDTFSWSFDSGVEAFDYLAAGESLVLTYTLTVTDAPTGATDTQDVVITINGTNDAPVISIEAGDSAAESLIESNAGLTVSDTLTTTDLDLTDTVSVAVTSVVESGNTSGIANATLLGMMNATTGNFIDGAETQDIFTWSFDSGLEAFDYLAAGESLVLTYTLTVTDSESATDTQDVVITINGTNDAPVISIEAGDSAAESLIESNAGLTVSDTLTTTDLDLTDTVSVAVTSVVESGNTSGIANATLLGMMSATTGNFIDGAETQDTFTWSFDSGVEAFDYLAAGESLVLTYTLTVTDAPTGATDTQTVVITINGTNDAPVISIEARDSAAESLIESNAGLTVSDTLTTTDLDLTDTVSVAVTSVVESGNTSGIANATLLGMMSATTGNFIDGAETVDSFTWSFDSGLEAFDYLAAGESLVLTYTLTVTDAPTGATDTQDVVITINGTN
ncbi:DUF4347 domain-containing protein, partial [Thiotrichales bacterium 19X7-9]|nr:DUF4347 domain-containing protein [Thiotrichales bacterium 19X7-9]